MLRISTGAHQGSMLIGFDMCRRKTLSAEAVALIVSDVFSMGFEHPDVSSNVKTIATPHGSRLQVELCGEAFCTPEQARTILNTVRRWPNGFVIVYTRTGTRNFDTTATEEFDGEGVYVNRSVERFIAPTPRIQTSSPRRAWGQGSGYEGFQNTAPAGL